MCVRLYVHRFIPRIVYFFCGYVIPLENNKDAHASVLLKAKIHADTSESYYLQLAQMFVAEKEKLFCFSIG